MSKKKKKSSAAENLIESLMDDLKDIQVESSFRSGLIDANPPAQSQSDAFAGLPSLDANEHRIENTNSSENLWKGFDVNEPELAVSSADLGFELPEAEEEDFAGASSEDDLPYQGPSADAGYQSPDDILSHSDSEPSQSAPSGEDKTVSIQQDLNLGSATFDKADAEKTLAVEGFANVGLGSRRPPASDVRVSVGQFRGGRGAGNAMTSVDASLAQAENLRLAQQRILELEKEVEQLRAENEELASAGEIVRSRMDELGVKVSAMEKEKNELQESARSEMLILKGNLQFKESEVAKARLKVEELETRLKSDFKKIRVRERELENRLELLRAEKSALVRSKDEYILEQKRKIDQLSQELDNYRRKCLELNKTIEANQDQVKRTERALRLALTNLEANEESLVPLKKAE